MTGGDTACHAPACSGLYQPSLAQCVKSRTQCTPWLHPRSGQAHRGQPGRDDGGPDRGGRAPELVLVQAVPRGHARAQRIGHRAKRRRAHLPGRLVPAQGITVPLSSGLRPGSPKQVLKLSIPCDALGSTEMKSALSCSHADDKPTGCYTCPPALLRSSTLQGSDVWGVLARTGTRARGW